MLKEINIGLDREIDMIFEFGKNKVIEKVIIILEEEPNSKYLLGPDEAVKMFGQEDFYIGEYDSCDILINKNKAIREED